MVFIVNVHALRLDRFSFLFRPVSLTTYARACLSVCRLFVTIVLPSLVSVNHIM